MSLLIVGKVCSFFFKFDTDLKHIHLLTLSLAVYWR